MDFHLAGAIKWIAAMAYIMPGIAIVFLIFGIISPAFIFHSVEGPGSMNAPFIAALLAGLIVGALAQRSRLCMAGSIRDIFLIGDFHLLKVLLPFLLLHLC